MEHPSASPNLLYVKKAGRDGRTFVQMKCPKHKQFERLQRLQSWLPNVAEENVDARSYVFDMSDLSPLSAALTVQTMRLFDARNDWPGKFSLMDVAFSSSKDMVVGTPEWLLSLASRSGPIEHVMWYDAIQNLTGREFVYLDAVYFPIIGRSIAALQKLEAVIAEEKVKLNKALLETLETYDENKDNVHFDDVYL